MYKREILKIFSPFEIEKPSKEFILINKKEFPDVVYRNSLPKLFSLNDFIYINYHDNSIETCTPNSVVFTDVDKNILKLIFKKSEIFEMFGKYFQVPKESYSELYSNIISTNKYMYNSKCSNNFITDINLIFDIISRSTFSNKTMGVLLDIISGTELVENIEIDSRSDIDGFNKNIEIVLGNAKNLTIVMRYNDTHIYINNIIYIKINNMGVLIDKIKEHNYQCLMKIMMVNKLYISKNKKYKNNEDDEDETE